MDFTQCFVLQVVQCVVQEGFKYVEAAEEKKIKLDLIEALREVSEGKVGTIVFAITITVIIIGNIVITITITVDLCRVGTCPLDEDSL